MKKNLLLTTFVFLFSKFLNAQAPDFKTGISFSYGYNTPTKTLNLTWDFFNVGGGTSTTFTIAYIASTDLTIDGSDFLIDQFAYAGAVSNAFATKTFTYAFGPGDLPNGVYNLIVYLDFGNDVAESNENNNIVSFGTFNFVGTTGLIENATPTLSFNVFPNPSSDGELNVTINSDKKADNPNIKIYNLEGKEVYSKQLAEMNMVEHNKLYLNDLPKGLYFVQLLSGNSVLSSQKVLIE
ncbi:MAG: T9SS type A sorting domain-containing protein [Bacteroidota bacterium]|nr:T9SS type A sorting domain-containing protein [Bacteroidota bacterium]